MAKTYVIAKVTYYKDGVLYAQLQLYRRILEDGTDLRWSYNIGREPLMVEDGKYIDVEDIRQKMLARIRENNIDVNDVDYVY